MADLNFERKLKVHKTVENASPSVKEKIMRDYDRISFRDDSEFETYLAETQAYVDFKDENKASDTGISQNVQDWLKEKDTKTSLGGKDLNAAFQVSGSSSAAGSLSGKSI